LSILANISGRSLGQVSKDIKQKMAPIEQTLPSGYFIEFGGQYQEMQNAFKAMAGAFLLVALLITGRPINLPVLIGIVLLGGIAVNNGIVMVDYINQLMRKGVERREAVLQGCAVRLRPVLITALTTVVGMLPMAISTSSGAEIRAPLAITVLGGLIATTFLTLFVIPIIYSLFEKVSFSKNRAIE